MIAMNAKIAQIFLLVFLILIPSQNSNASEQASYSVYFGKKYLCELDALIDDDDEVELNNKNFFDCLEGVLDPKRLNELKVQLGSADTLTTDDLEQMEIDLDIDSQYFRLELDTPKEWLAVNPIQLRASRPKNQVNDLKESIVSGYLNYHLDSKYEKTSQAPATKNTTNTAHLNPVLGLGGVILESHHQIKQTKDDREYTRIGSYLTKDFESANTRLQVGDVSLRSPSLMSSANIMGFQIHRDFSMTSDLVTYPQGENEFFLDQHARVDVFVNGILINVLNLEAGRHVLEDIPAHRGLNSVRLKITYDNGTTRFLDLQSPVEESLLKLGLMNFTMAGGVVSSRDEDKINYSRKSIGSAFISRGMTNYWTMGLFAQGSKSHGLAGLTETFSTNLGIFKIDSAFSQSENQKGQAYRGEYAWICPCGYGGHGRRFSLGAEYYTEKYLISFSPTVYAETSRKAVLIAGFSAGFTERISGQIQVTKNSSYSDDQDYIGLSTDLNFSVSKNLWSGLRYNQSRSTEGLMHREILLQVYGMLDDQRTSLLASSTASNQTRRNRLDALYRNEQSTISAQSSFETTPDYINANVSGGYVGDFAELGVSAESNRDHGIKRDTYNLRPSGSIVFADGYSGLGPYVHNAVLLVKNNREETYFLNGDPLTHELDIPGKSTRVSSKVNAYNQKSISLLKDPNYDPSDEEIVNQSVSGHMKYKQAMILEIKGEQFFTIQGVLVDHAKKPIPLVGGKLIGTSVESEVKFFTDYNGKFTVPKMKPGKYKFVIFSRPFEFAEIDVLPPHSGRVSQIGDVELKVRGGVIKNKIK